MVLNVIKTYSFQDTQATLLASVKKKTPPKIFTKSLVTTKVFRKLIYLLFFVIHSLKQLFQTNRPIVAFQPWSIL